MAPDLHLSLEHMTVLGLTAAEIIDAAELLGVGRISLILDSGPYALPAQSFLREPELVKATRSRLRQSSVSVHAAEGFLLDEQTDQVRLERLLEIAAALDAERVVAMVVDPDRGRTIENFGRLCERAQPFNLQVSLEFVAFTPVRSLADAMEMVGSVAALNGAISVDILHLMRSGGAPSDLGASDLKIGAAQLCDGPARAEPGRLTEEAMSGRLDPGDGAFPIAEFLAALPPGLVVGVETPKGGNRSHPELIASARRSLEAARRASERFG